MLRLSILSGSADSVWQRLGPREKGGENIGVAYVDVWHLLEKIC